MQVWVVRLLPCRLEVLFAPGSQADQVVPPCRCDPVDLDRPEDGGKHNPHLTDIWYTTRQMLKEKSAFEWK